MRLKLGMKFALTIVATAFATVFPSAAPAAADFGAYNYDVTYENEDGSPTTQAGSHPFSLNTLFQVNSTEVGFFEYVPDGEIKDDFFDQIPGLVGNATATPRCSTADFASGLFSPTFCSTDSQVGVVAPSVFIPFAWFPNPVYNLEPPPGVAVRLGFPFLPVRIVIDVRVRPGGEYNVAASQTNVPQTYGIFGAYVQLWGNPADHAHDRFRETGLEGACRSHFYSTEEATDINEVKFFPGGTACPSTVENPKPFLTLPTNCSGPLEASYEIESWQNPGAWLNGSVLSHDGADPPNPQGFSGCGKLGFNPELDVGATSDSAESGTGLDVDVNFRDEGLLNPAGLAQSQANKAVVTLPEGMTINPSVGEGLGICTRADYARETLHSEAGEGCPNSSKVGNLHIDTPLIDEGIDGSVYLAQQDDPATVEPGKENPFDSLIALYLVLRNKNLNVLVRLPLKVEPDPSSGRLVATLEDIPQIPFSHFNFHFKEGVRAALVTPSACGTYTTEAKFYPWSDPANSRTVFSSFEVTRGKGGGSCPPGGIPPFDPSFEAGAINNNAGSFSPFNMRLIREDGEQDMTKFSAILPPGEIGSLKGVDKCPDSAVGTARGKTGRQELAEPSCPSNSLIGHTLAGAGVGSALTYVKGYTYLGGPYNGSPLSVISVTPAVAGPFDAGTVVVRLALDLNPKTAEVEVNGANSDPIPHIIKGIVLKLRDLRVYVDRPNFTLNPTSCDESSARSVLFGSYLNVLDPADDRPVDLSTRYQAANCLNLGFKPKLGLNLKGGTRRGGHPGLKAVYSPKPHDANIEGLTVRLPRSAFLDQAHIKTICTRVQFAADNCPKNAQYGYIRAWTPLLDEPLQGPVWLRSSNHKLPDLVFDLHGLVDIEVATRIDSARGGIRATLEDAPDAPLSRVVLNMRGGKKSLIINSRNLCRKANRNRANVLATGQNGKQSTTKPVMRPLNCAKKRRHKRHHKRGGRVARSSVEG